MPKTHCNCANCRHKLCASKVPIFASLSVDELEDIVDMTGHRQLQKGEMVFFEGDPSNTLFIVNEGQIKLYKYTKEGKEQIMYILSEGEFFGELSLLKEDEHRFNAEALSNVLLCTLTKTDMDSLLNRRPEIAVKLLQVVGERLGKVESLVQNLATNDMEARIANMLLEFKNSYGHSTGDGWEIQLPLTREDMANYIGVTRETISRKLSQFQTEGIIRLIGNKRIRIIDEQRLLEFAG